MGKDETVKYARIERGIWDKARFRSISDDGRLLFFYIITCKHNNMAGMFILRPGYACEDMDWSRERFDKGLGELLQAGLIKHDPTTRIVFDPHQLEKFPPQNPNQAISLMSQIKSLPNTPLLKDLLTICKRLGKPFMEPFTKRLGERSGNIEEVEVEVKEEVKEKQRAKPMPPPVDKKELTALFLKAKDHYPSQEQLRQIQLFIETNGKGNIKAISHCLRRLSEEAEKGKPVLIIGKWLEKIMRDEEPIYNARDAEAETARYKADFTSVEDIFGRMPR